MSQVDHSDSGTENNNSPPPQAPTTHCLLQYRNGLFQGFANEFNQRQGKGIYIWNTGELYYGNWTHDCMEGEGIFYFSLGGYVYGTFLNNKVHGYAILYFQDGDYLAGFWQEGILIGKVIQHSREADEWFLYEYKNGSPSRTISQGKGSPPLSSFSTLETGYLKKLLDKELNLFKEDNSERNGQQKNLEFLPIDPTGWYHGNTRSKKPHGLGIVCYSENRSDRGQFRKGDMNGPGRSIFANNDVYEGFYIDGKFSGTGVYFKGESEQHLYGTYEDNECVQPITLGEGYPHDLMRDIKTEFVMERAEFIDQETEAEVLKLFSPNQENHEQQQTQEQPSSAQIETEPKTETEPEVEVQNAVRTEGESEPEVQGSNHDNIIKRQIEIQVAENMVRKEAQEHYYEEEDDDVDSEEEDEEEEEEYNNGEFLKELDSMGGPNQNIVAQSQVETKVVEQMKPAARDFSQKSNSIEQNVKETVSVHAKDPSSGYSSVGGKVVESRNVVYFEEEEDEQGRKWTSIHQVVSKQGSSDKGMTSSNPSIKSIKEEFKDNKGYDTNKRAIKMTEILENHSISKEDTERDRITSEAHDTHQSGYSDKRVSLPMNPMNLDLNSLKREVKKDSIFKSSKESTPVAYQSVSSNIRTEETDLNAFRDVGWTEEEEKIDNIVAHIRNKNEIKARGMDSVGSSISNRSSVQGRPFSLAKDEHADGPLLGKFSSAKSYGSIKDVINEVKMSIKKELVPVHQGGYIVRESVVTDRLLAKPLQPEPSRQSRLKSDSSVDTIGSDKGTHQTHIKTDIQKIMNDVLEKSRANSRKESPSMSPDARATGDSGIKRESASKGINKIADLEYSQPINVNPGVQKAVTDFIHSISYQSGAKENVSSRVPGAININDSMAKNTSGTASLETSLMERERDAPKLYHGGSFGAVSSGHYDQHSSARGHPDQQTSRFGQTLDIPGTMDFHRERASSGQSGGNPGSNSGVFNNSQPIVVETQEIIPEKRQSLRQSLTQMNPILAAALTKDPPKYSMPIETLTLTIPEQRSPMHLEQLRSPEFCNTRLNGLENAAQFPVTSPFLLHENYIHPKDKQTENPVKSGVRTAQVTEESQRTGNTNNSVRLDTMSNRGDTPSNRIDSASNRIETISGRIDTGSSESWTGSAHTCSERSVAASLTTSQILRKYGLDTYQENPGSRPDLIKKLIVPIEQNRRASIVYMKRKDPKEKDFQEVSHHVVPEKEKEKVVEVVKEIEKEKENEKEKAAQRLEEELYKVIVLKLELMVKEQNKMTEAVDGVRKVLNEKLDVLFRGDQKEKEIYKSDFTSTIDVMLQQRTRDMTLDQVMKMYHEMKEHFKHLESSVSGINNKLERLLERQGQASHIPVVINPSDSYYYRAHQENTSQIDIQKALQHFHEQDKMLSDRLTVLEAAASKPQQQPQVSASEVVHQRRVMKPGTPQKMVQQSSQKKEIPKMKLPNAGSNVLLEGSIDMSEESQTTSTQEKVFRSPVKEQANRSEKKEPKKNSHRSDRVDTTDYMSITAEESARPKAVNAIQPKSSELSLKNNRTLNLLEYEDQLRRSHTDTMHTRTHSQDIKIPPKVSTPVNRTSAAPPQRSYTPTPQTRTRFDLTNNYQQHNTTVQDQPRSPRPIFSHTSSAVLDPILTPIKGCLMEDIFNCKEAPLGNQREEPVYQDNKVHRADRKLLNIQSTRSNVMNRAHPSQSPDRMLRASVDYQHYHPNQHHNGVTTPQGSFHPSFLKQTGPREIQSATKAELSWANGPKMMSSGKKNYGGGYQEVELYEDEHGHIIEQPKQVTRTSYGPRRDTEGPVMHESESYHQTSPLRYRKEPVSPYNKGQYQYQEGNMGSVKWRLEVQENGNTSALLGSPLDRMGNARRSTNRSNIRDITGHYTQGEPSYRSYTQDTESSMRKEHKLKAGIPGIREYNEKPRDYVTVHDMSPPDSHRKVYKMSSQAKHNFIVDTRSPTLAMTSETLAKHPDYYGNMVDTKKWDGYGRESGSYSIQRNYLVGEGDTLKRAAPSQFF